MKNNKMVKPKASTNKRSLVELSWPYFVATNLGIQTYCSYPNPEAKICSKKFAEFLYENPRILSLTLTGNRLLKTTFFELEESNKLQPKIFLMKELKIS